MSSSSKEPKRKESDVYDRQIRLWGAEAQVSVPFQTVVLSHTIHPIQAKMAKSKVLYVHITGVSSEILKNLVLAGIQAVICDDRPFPEAVATTPNFFLHKEDRESKKAKRTVADVLKPKVEELNPLLGDCEIVSFADLTDTFLQQFSIVFCSRMTTDALRISQAVVKGGGKFYMADTFGLSGAAVVDLGKDHMYRPETGNKLLEATTLKDHLPLEDLLQVPIADAIHVRFHPKPIPQWIQYRCLLEYVEQKKAWPTKETAQEFCDFVTEWVKTSAVGSGMADDKVLQPAALKQLAGVATAEILPVCSVLGGILGTEAIKVISGKGEPANNTLLFDGASGKVFRFLVKAKN